MVVAWGKQRTQRLAGLSPAALYVDDATGAVHHATMLLTHGLPLDLPKGDRPSTVVQLTRQ
ncbi:GH36 C-terminal domain-containing protein [Streptomyces sp. NBC_01465]|uniref:GH36 C-terminal domain-containing protein n=1 Tax=Streptomyces sp. NBC_01465 TaxID=2903878 RepID=UPI002E37F04C|nr:GH36 C-terminal domain-containing protein [Streptomyces sp. NBC_01465]